MKALNKRGFVVLRQRGSHISMASADGKRRTIIPRHDEIKPGTLLDIIEQANLTKEEFIELID
ncbi:MAG: type II toxin-antitoxin system HicA family toxin [Nitrososphaerales archaeon]